MLGRHLCALVGNCGWCRITKSGTELARRGLHRVFRTPGGTVKTFVGSPVMSAMAERPHPLGKRLNPPQNVNVSHCICAPPEISILFSRSLTLWVYRRVLIPRSAGMKRVGQARTAMTDRVIHRGLRKVIQHLKLALIESRPFCRPHGALIEPLHISKG